MRKGMFVLFSLLCLCGFDVFAQNTDELKEVYEKDKRDVKAVTEYVEALGETQKRTMADSIVKEYNGSLSGCAIGRQRHLFADK